MDKNSRELQKGVEPEFQGSFWRHPYMIYMYGTLGFFLLLIILAYIGFKMGMVADRGLSK